MKNCSRCGEMKTPDSFSKGKGAFGRRANCKACASASGVAYYSKNKPAITAKHREYSDSHKAEKSAYAAAYRAKNADKISKYHADLYLRNKAEIDARNIKWGNDNRERKAAYAALWSKENAARVRAKVAARRFAKLNATPKWADKSKIEAIYSEARRLTRDTGVCHEVDHIIPLKGETAVGLHVHYNLQILTMTENRRKSNSMPGASC